MGKVQLKISVLVISFLLIWLGLQFAPVAELDRQLTLQIYDLAHNEVVNTFFRYISDYAIGSLAVVMVVALLVHWRHSLQAAIIFVASAGGVSLLVEVSKFAFARLRPFAASVDITSLTLGVTDGYGFPSGHAAVAVFVAFFLEKVLKLPAVQSGLVYGLAILVALSRVYLGVHFVFDVIAGGLVGLAMGWLVVDEWYDRGVERLRIENVE